MIRKGDEVTIKPEWRDQGDEEFTWVACDDEEKGRVTITPVNTGLAIPPRQTVNVEMLKQNSMLCVKTHSGEAATEAAGGVAQ